MKFNVDISIMPYKKVPDNEGLAITKLLRDKGYTECHDLHVGKHYTMKINAESREIAMEKVNQICREFLVNDEFEGFSYDICPVEE